MVTPFCVCVCACSFACNHVYIRKYIYMQSDVPSPIWLEGGGLISLFLLVSTFPFHFCFLVVHLPLWLFFLRLHKTISIYTPLALDFPPSTACLLYLAVTVSHCSSLVRTQSMHCALSSLLRNHVNPRNLISEQKLFPLIYWSAFILSTNDFVNMNHTKTIKESVWIWDSWRMTNSYRSWTNYLHWFPPTTC